MALDLLQLPTPLLLLLATSHLIPSASAQQWPYNLPPHQKYWPEHENLVLRDAEVRQQLATQTPTAMQKMSSDPNQMFFLDYWQFDAPSEGTFEGGTIDSNTPQDTTDQEDPTYSNASIPNASYEAPYLLHSSTSSPALSLRHLSHLFKRDFQCPTNTTACTNIQRPNSCCPSSSTCVLISDSGIGDVGCCPQGQTCGGSVSTCDTAQGYTSCPNSGNGGCCIPGFACNGIGCAVGGGTSTTVQNVVVTVTVTPGNMTVTSTSTPPLPPPSSSSTISTSVVVPPPVIPPPPQTPSTSTTYTTLNPGTTTAIVSANSVTQSTPTQGTLTCSTGFNTCAPSLGGGCCPTDRACGPGGFCPPLNSTSSSSSSSASAAPPVRPTSDTDSSSATAPTTTTGPSLCPTGFYMCSATYIAGCCQVGRNCDTTDCPASTTNTITSNGNTILVPGAGVPTTVGSVSNVDSSSGASVTAATASSSGAPAQGTCAQGFNSCAADQGGGCCPTGFACGQVCTNTGGVAGPTAVGKAPPASGSAANLKVDFIGWGALIVAIGMGVGAFVL